jgi:hypothetical protein
MSSYDENARRPTVRSIWVWRPRTCPQLIEVTEVIWNGEEWFVRTDRPSGLALDSRMRGPGLMNDLDVFWEACHAVAPKPGAPMHGSAIASGPPTEAERAWAAANA